MQGPVACKDACIEMHPSANFGGLASGRKRINFCLLVRLDFDNFAFVFLVELVATLGDEDARVNNSRDLCTKQVLLLSKEERIAHDIALKIT